jgi:hypothetical protein
MLSPDLDASLYGFLRGYSQARDVAAADVMRELIRQMSPLACLMASASASRHRISSAVTLAEKSGSIRIHALTAAGIKLPPKQAA